MNTNPLPWTSDEESPDGQDPLEEVGRTSRARRKRAEARGGGAERVPFYDPEIRYTVVIAALQGELTQREIAERFGVTQPLVSIWKKSALAAIRADIEARAAAPRGRKREDSLSAVLRAADVLVIGSVCGMLENSIEKLNDLRALIESGGDNPAEGVFGSAGLDAAPPD